MSRASAEGTRPIGVSSVAALLVAALEDPRQHAAVLAEAGPEESTAASLRNQLTMKIFGRSAPSRGPPSQCAK